MREATDYHGNQPIPGRLGQSVTVQGTLISEPIPVGNESSLADLQDATGGITLYSPNRTLLAGHVHRGDEVRVNGTIEQYKGQTELLVQQIDRLGAGALRLPRDVLTADLIGARYLGQLVRVEGRVHLTKDSHGHSDITLSDRSGEVLIHVGSLLLQDPELSRQLAKEGFATIVGVANYYQSGRAPTESAYRLIPRDPADFVFRPVPPYKLIASGLAFLCFILSCIYLALRRRNAERRAQEMAVLIQNLEQSEKALRQSAQRYRLLFDRNLAGLFHSTLEGRILDCNDSFARILGYDSREEVLCLSGGAQDFYNSASEREVFLTELHEKRVLTNLENRLRRKDGSTVWVLENASLLDSKGDSPTIIEGMLIDITERKRLEEQFRQAQKMEAIGKLAGGVGHDFNNLLTIIKGNTELLLGRTEPSEPLHQNVSQIAKAADQAAELIRQLLAFSRMQVLEPRVLDLNHVIAETGKMIPRLLREDIEVVLHLGASLGRVKADQNQIDQILLNLAANARDAMPNGGKLAIETANVNLNEGDERLHSGMKPGQYVMLAVTDTGTGMDAQTQAHIFEPFFTTKEPGKGTGLGLAIVYGIVKQSGGWIWVSSKVGRGTAFKIYFPEVEEPVRAERTSGPRVLTPRGSETVLLVEDQEGIRELARSFLRDMGYQVLEAADGEAALQVAQQHEGEIDLLLTDIVMPRMGGHKLAERMAALSPKTRVLYMSGYAEYVENADGNSHHDEFHLQKPFSMGTLAHRVREALNA